LIASVCGIIEKVNRLISVKPLKSRYNGDIGDIVVGRITNVGAKRWLVDVQGRKDATLLLSSINLPDGVQRRKTYEDQLNMRQLYVENDLIVAEVQQILGNSTLSLQTRSSRFGKLENGQFLVVDCSLVKRCQQHFHKFDFGVDVILGNNGYIWITGSGKMEKEKEKIVRIRNSILVLEKQFIPIYPSTILDVYEESISLPMKEILNPKFFKIISKKAYDRIREEKILI
jgi:exosome complex component RRP4